MKVGIICPQCGCAADIESGAVNRAARINAPIYCGRICGGLARRKWRARAELKAMKSAYDAKRRIDLADKIKADKRAYHKRTYDPAAAAEARKANMPRHVEYCRQPEYVEWKAEYDRQYRAKKEFGPFWEASLLLLDLNSEVLSRATRYEIDLQNGKLNKRNRRKDGYEKTLGG